VVLGAAALGACTVRLVGRTDTARTHVRAPVARASVTSVAQPAPTTPPPRRVVARITGDGAHVIRDPQRIRGTHTADLREGDLLYPIVEQASLPNERHAPPEALIVDGPGACGPEGGSCLWFVGHEWPAIPGAGGANDRIEVELSTADAPDALRLGQWRYLRFVLRVDPETAPLQGGTDTLIAQVWQNHGRMPPGRGFGPPLRVGLENASGPDVVRLSFRYANDTTPSSVEFHTEELTKGLWYTFHLAMRPQHVEQDSEPGTILVWRDQPLDFAFDTSVPARNQLSRFHWGYAPVNVRRDDTCADATSPCVKARFSIRVGIYRDQAAQDPGLTRTAFRMDSLELTMPHDTIPSP
jgi:hypothetical protein